MSQTFEILEWLFPWSGLWVVLILIILSKWLLMGLKSLMKWLSWWSWSCCSILLVSLRLWKVGIVYPFRIVSIRVRFVAKMLSHHIYGISLISWSCDSIDLAAVNDGIYWESPTISLTSLMFNIDSPMWSSFIPLISLTFLGDRLCCLELFACR